jgi:hypothetical protein
MPDGWLTNRYNYRVVRRWQEDAESYLRAGVNLVPLAPLAAASEPELPALVRRMAERINAEPPPRAAKLWTATYLLMGLRYSEELVSRLLIVVQRKLPREISSMSLWVDRALMEPGTPDNILAVRSTEKFNPFA